MLSVYTLLHPLVHQDMQAWTYSSGNAKHQSCQRPSRLPRGFGGRGGLIQALTCAVTEAGARVMSDWLPATRLLKKDSPGNRMVASRADP